MECKTLDVHPTLQDKLHPVLSNWTKQMQIPWITTSLIQCRYDGNRWHQMRRCTSGTFSDACRSVSSRTRNRKHGSTLSKQRPLRVNCSMDMSTGPVKQKKSFKNMNSKLFLNTHANRQHKWPCNHLFLHSGSHLHFECSPQVSWPSLSSCAVWICPPNKVKETWG